MDKDTLIKNVKNKLGDLKEAEIEGLLYEISAQKDILITDLVIKTGIPMETVKSVVKYLTGIASISDEGKISVTPEFLIAVPALNLHSYKWTILEFPDKSLSDQLKQIRAESAFSPVRDYDQFYATAESSVAKFQLLKQKGIIEGKKILLLGDDDLISIVLLLSGEKPELITVLDIDDGLLNKIGTIAGNLKGKVETIKYDCRNAIPLNLKEKYDVVITDPPYTKNGIQTFLTRAYEFVKKDSGYVCLYYGNSFKSPEKTLKIQEIITKMRFLIEDKIDKFIRYHGAYSIGAASSVYLLKTTPFTQVIPGGKGLSAKGFYTYETQKEDKFPYVDHFTFKLYGVDEKIINSKTVLISLAQEFAKKHHLKIIDKKTTEFKNQGFTFTFILSSSNMVFHTWPEFNALHIDLITCAPVYNRDLFAETIDQLFKPEFFDINHIE